VTPPSLLLWPPLVALVLAGASFTQQPSSLIVNGSFEEGPGTVRFLNLPGGNTSLPGWVVTGEGIDLVSTGYWISSDGARAIDLDGSARSRKTPPHMQGGIAQTFATTPGTRYFVTFDLAGNPAQPPRVKPMRISAAGQSAEFTFDVAGRNGRNMGWTPQRWTFTATDASTTLEFTSLTVSPQTGYGAAIDNVVVVPEPATPLKIVESEAEVQVNLGAEVLFDSGRFDLKPAASTALEEVLSLLGKYPGSAIAIEGHTDSVGTTASNQTLSQNRAASVRAWLVSRGVTATRITARGRGESSPVASNDTPEGRQQNRRVEIRIRKPSDATMRR
jgi:choice-of-anchor C domain-containing protein